MAEPKACKLSVKDKFGRVAECSNEIVGSEPCSNRKSHINPIKTGFCSSGWHEGTSPKTHSGKSAPTCKFWSTCPCSCHQTYDEMFTIAERIREVVDNSGYMPDYGDFKMPTLEERLANGPATIIPSELPDSVPATVIPKAFTPTPTGRTQKGELELWVKEVCDAWLIDETEHPCTPNFVSEQIARRQGIRPPSVGAIDAVWVRWTLLGFAVIEKKPTRFTRYTEEGIKLTLQGMKERNRRKQAPSRY